MKQVHGEELVSTGPQGNQGARKVTGGADFHAKPIRLSGMGKGSAIVRGVAPKGCSAV